MLDRERVAELIVASPSGRRRASGYRVTSACIITAMHAIQDADSITVRFHPSNRGPWTCVATIALADASTDIALLEIQPAESQEADISVARFGRVSDRAAVLHAEAVGFPRWKLRIGDIAPADTAIPEKPFRDSAHAHGSLAVLANLKEGTLEFSTLDHPPELTSEGGSPWEGMSGAALWVNGRIVGVITSNYAIEGPSKLAVARLDRFLAVVKTSARKTLDRLLLSRVGDPSRLPDVVPPSTAEQFQTAYRAQLESIAPVQLVCREAELDELIKFCAAEAQPSYMWWQAGPWSGKTALLSWFTLNPPAGLDIVAFFITSRFAGQADSNAFLEAILEQLVAIVGEQPSSVLSSHVRIGHYLRLLKDAAQRSEETGRRLIIVIDGLDEDHGANDQLKIPSIASLLPMDPPANVRIVVSSRYSPQLPQDLHENHPLRSARRLDLAASPYARNLSNFALGELREQLRGSDLQQQILGLITAAGGGLTAADLHALTRNFPYKVRDLLQGRLGRSVSERRTVGQRDGGTEIVYLFAHETLRELAEEDFGSDLADFREVIHQWAEDYRKSNWPSSTPSYLLRGYFQMLNGSGDLARMFVCACDRARHDALLNLTGGDALALSEVGNAISIVRSQHPLDLRLLLPLEIAREELVVRNSRMPPELSRIWTLVGQPARGTSVANGILDPIRRVEALCSIIEARETSQEEAVADLVAAAESAINEIRPVESRVIIRRKVALALARRGSFAAASRIIAQISDDYFRLEGVADIALIAMQRGRRDEVDVMASIDREAARVGDMPGPQRDRAISFLIAAAIAVEDHELVESLTASLRDQGAIVLAIQHIAARGSIERAHLLAKSYGDASTRARALAVVAAAAVPHADLVAVLLQEAREALSSVTHPYTRAVIESELTVVVSSERELQKAASIAGSAPPHVRDTELAELSRVAARYGYTADAQRITASIHDSGVKERAWREVVRESIRCGAVPEALRLMEMHLSLREQIRLKAELLQFGARKGEDLDPRQLIECTTQAARMLDDAENRSSALSDVGVAVALHGSKELAIAIAKEAEEAALATTLRATHVQAVRALIAAGTSIADYRRCIKLVEEFPTHAERDSVLTNICYHAVSHSHTADAVEASERIFDSTRRQEVLCNSIIYIGARGDYGAVLKLYPLLDEADEALRLVGTRAAEVGSLADAEQIFDRIADSLAATKLLVRLSLTHVDGIEARRVGAAALNLATTSGPSLATDVATASQARVAAKLGDLEFARAHALRLVNQELRDNTLLAILNMMLGSATGHEVITPLISQIASAKLRVSGLLRAARTTDAKTQIGWIHRYLASARDEQVHLSSVEAERLAEDLADIERSLSKFAASSADKPHYGGEGRIPDASAWFDVDAVIGRAFGGGEPLSEIREITRVVEEQGIVSSKLGIVRSLPGTEEPLPADLVATATREIQKLRGVGYQILDLKEFSHTVDCTLLVDAIKRTRVGVRDSSLMVVSRFLYDGQRWDCMIKVSSLIKDASVLYGLALHQVVGPHAKVLPDYVRARVVSLTMDAIQASPSSVTTRDRATLAVALITLLRWRETSTSVDFSTEVERDVIDQLMQGADWLSQLAAVVYSDKTVVAAVIDEFTGAADSTFFKGFDGRSTGGGESSTALNWRTS